VIKREIARKFCDVCEDLSGNRNKAGAKLRGRGVAREKLISALHSWELRILDREL